MNNIHLDDNQLSALHYLIATTPLEATRKRAYGIVFVHSGYSIRHAAKLAGISRNTLRTWLRRFEAEGVDVLSERPQGGRLPRPPSMDYCTRLEYLLASNPREWGYDEPAWTVKTLRHQMQTDTGIWIGERRLRQLLHESGYRYRSTRSKVQRELTDDTIRAMYKALRQPDWEQPCTPAYAWVKDAV